MSHFTPADTLHRLVKEAIDSGAAESVAEAEVLLPGLSTSILDYARRTLRSARIRSLC